MDKRAAAVVTLVHGTFAREAAWVAPGSPLATALRAAGCEVVRFQWSGGNSHRARARAARELTRCLEEQNQRDPLARKWVIAHSHGGNVAVAAVRQVRNSVQALSRVSVITLATPFLHLRPRATPGWLRVVLLLCTPLLLADGLHTAARGPGSALDWAAVVLVVLIVVTSALVAVGAWLHWEGLRGRGIPPWRGAEPVRPINARDLFVVRSAGDEAAAVLAFGQFVSWLGGVAARLLGHGLLWGVAAFVTVLGAGASMVTDARSYPFLLLFPIPGYLVVAVTFAMLLATTVFGVDGPFLGLFVFQSAEAAPAGEASILQLEPFHTTDRRGLAHSRLYHEDRVIRRILRLVQREP